jgi:hypothetical protein
MVRANRSFRVGPGDQAVAGSNGETEYQEKTSKMMPAPGSSLLL